MLCNIILFNIKIQSFAFGGNVCQTCLLRPLVNRFWGEGLCFFIFFYCMLIECKKENNIKEKSLHTTVYTYTKYVLPIILLYLMWVSILAVGCICFHLKPVLAFTPYIIQCGLMYFRLPSNVIWVVHFEPCFLC